MNSTFLFQRHVKQGLIVLGLMAAGLFAIRYLGVDLAHAQLISPEDSPDNITSATGGEGSFKSLARTIVNFALYFLGFIATVMIIYGGLLYVTAAGNEENAQKAKKILMYAIIGIVIILLSFAIVNTVLTAGTGSVATT
ncbi:MAG: hypothetical protein UT55_C0088G0004 [Candidatus Peregrinibacteria bacterium GW2011_GWE2_39_6]|nr:MAG: hypothetical protein UT36_C0011G0004 [Candidatus Peregrinibacteria bacterium GW2011_GWF2_39_17]KKR23579.1 MAG: hypothetical protein UT55_C0088G0004 [Candidatus Peregrinibacteria bacterium GW2011_GWE2_39_6]